MAGTGYRGRDRIRGTSTATAAVTACQGVVQSEAEVEARPRCQQGARHDRLRVVHEVEVGGLLDSRCQGQAGLKAGRDRPLTSAVQQAWGKDMNDTEEIMTHELLSNTLIVHDKALEAAGVALSLIGRVPAPLKSIADQVVRSASSVPANISEGHGRAGRDRIHHYRIAYASAKEVDSHLRLLAQANAIDRTRTNTALRLFDEVRAMTWRLIHRRAR